MSDEAQLTISIIVAAGSVRVQVAGELDMAVETELVETVATAVADHDASSLELDVTHVTFIDSSGLRALLRCRDNAERSGLEVTLIAGDGPVSRLLAVAGVKDWFTMSPVARPMPPTSTVKS